MKNCPTTRRNPLARINGPTILLTLAGIAAILALTLAVAALTAQAENPLAYPTVIPPPPADAPNTPATPPAPATPGVNPNIFLPETSAGAAARTGAAKHAPASTSRLRPIASPLKFVTAIIPDGQGQGGVYASDETTGIYHGVPNAQPDADAKAAERFTWTHLKTGEGTGTSPGTIYSLCLDAQGRLWAGSWREGVFVWNGEKWGHYDISNGPLGVHVVAITSNPRDQSVWMCDEAGIDIYDTKTNTWRYINQVQGLPPSPNCIAFDRDGTAFVGAACDGLAIAKPPYTHWRVIPGPKQMPLTAYGSGLPSDLINAVLVTKTHLLLVATDAGLATSSDGGETFAFQRGDDVAAKIAGLWHPPAGFKIPPKSQLDKLLPGDHLTCLAEDSGSHFYLGTWDDAFGAIDEHSGEQYRSKDDPAAQSANKYVSAILAYRSAGILPADASPPRSAGILPANGSPPRSAGILPADASPPRSAGILPADASPPRSAGILPANGSAAVPPAYNQPAGRMPALHSAILIGYYGGGLAEFNPGEPSPQGATGAPQSPPRTTPDDLFTIHGNGQYGSSATSSPRSQGPDPEPPTPSTPASIFSRIPGLPAPAKAPTMDELAALLKSLGSPKPAPGGASPLVTALPDDWLTQGDWIGRYGRYSAVLFAICSPEDYVWGAGAVPMEYDARIGPHCTKDDSLRYWVEWLYTTNRNSLELPPTYMHSRVVYGLTTWSVNRREAEADDHGETYAKTFEGPDIYLSLRIPNGQFILSLYDYNKDGHSPARWHRDFRISTRAHTAPSLYNVDDFGRQAELAHARISNFAAGGVYKRFLVQGPISLTIKVGRNYSFDTILAGAFLDTIDETPAPYFATQQAARNATTIPAEAGTDAAPSTPAQILAQLDKLRTASPMAWATRSRLDYAQLQRWIASTAPSGADPRHSETVKTLGTCLCHLDYFQQWEQCQKQEGLTTAREIEKALRWDEKTYSYSGQEPRILANYLKAARGAAASSVEAVNVGQRITGPDSEK